MPELWLGFLTHLHRRPLAETGLRVLFVVAPGKDGDAAAESRKVLTAVKQLVLKAVTQFPGTMTDPTAARVGVANWMDLFPSPHSADAHFGRLPVERPTGSGDEDTRWEQTARNEP